MLLPSLLIRVDLHLLKNSPLVSLVDEQIKMCVFNLPSLPGRIVVLSIL